MDPPADVEDRGEGDARVTPAWMTFDTAMLPFEVVYAEEAEQYRAIWKEGQHLAGQILRSTLSAGEMRAFIDGWQMGWGELQRRVVAWADHVSAEVIQ